MDLATGVPQKAGTPRCWQGRVVALRRPRPRSADGTCGVRTNGRTCPCVAPPNAARTAQRAVPTRPVTPARCSALPPAEEQRSSPRQQRSSGGERRSNPPQLQSNPRQLRSNRQQEQSESLREQINTAPRRSTPETFHCPARKYFQPAPQQRVWPLRTCRKES